MWKVFTLCGPTCTALSRSVDNLVPFWRLIHRPPLLSLSICQVCNVTAQVQYHFLCNISYVWSRVYIWCNIIQYEVYRIIVTCNKWKSVSVNIETIKGEYITKYSYIYKNCMLNTKLIFFSHSSFVCSLLCFWYTYEINRILN